MVLREDVDFGCSACHVYMTVDDGMGEAKEVVILLVCWEMLLSGKVFQFVHCRTFQDIRSHLQSVQEDLPGLSEQEKSFLFDSSHEVLQFQETFATTVTQQEEVDSKLKEYLERVDSWERFDHTQ